MNELIDLHTHTTASDGIYSPEALIDLALRSHVKTLAITDHDTLGGLKAAIAYASKKSFDFIPGIEFSVDYPGGSFHLLGLYVDYEDSELIETTARLMEFRNTRASRILEDLSKYGIDIPHTLLEEISGGESMGRPHIARAMIKLGFAPDISAVFQNFLVKGKPGYVKKEKIKLSDAIRLIKKGHGIPIIAHPISLNLPSFKDFENLLEELMKAGIEGIEVFASMHSDREVEEFLKIALKYHLLITGGSDFHGDKEEVIGYYSNNRQIPFDLRDKIIPGGFK